jgi:hypothetical protein
MFVALRLLSRAGSASGGTFAWGHLSRLAPLEDVREYHRNTMKTKAFQIPVVVQFELGVADNAKPLRVFAKCFCNANWM